MPKPNLENKSSPKTSAVLAKYAYIIAGAAIVVIGVLAYMFVLDSKIKQVQNLQSFELAQLEDNLSRKQAYLADLEKMFAQYQKIAKADLDKISRILPAEADIPGLFVQIQALAEANDLLLSSITINDLPEAQGEEGAKTVAAGIKKLNISLELSDLSEAGGYEKVKQLLAALETNLRLFDITSVFFDPNSPDYTVELTTYYTL